MLDSRTARKSTKKYKERVLGGLGQPRAIWEFIGVAELFGTLRLPAARSFSQYQIWRTEGIPHAADEGYTQGGPGIWETRLYVQPCGRAFFTCSQTCRTKRIKNSCCEVRPDSHFKRQARVFAWNGDCGGLLLPVGAWRLLPGRRTQHNRSRRTATGTPFGKAYQKLRTEESATNRCAAQEKRLCSNLWPRGAEKEQAMVSYARHCTR